MTAGEIAAIADGKLFGLVHRYELDGRVSSHPADARGSSTINCYVLVEDDRALLLGTGYSVHQEALLAQLAELVGDRPLSLVIPRVEFASMCNARPIADRFRVEVIYQRNPLVPSLFLNFRPEFPVGDGDGLRDVEFTEIRTGTTAPVDRGAERVLEFLMPDLRLLPCNWAYDGATSTLFTGDLFSWVWSETEDAPLLIDDGGADSTTLERVERFLLQNRYWWLPGADTSRIRRSLADMFDRYEIDVIAPDHGSILKGAAVGRHYQLLDDLLASAPAMSDR